MDCSAHSRDTFAQWNAVVECTQQPVSVMAARAASSCVFSQSTFSRRRSSLGACRSTSMRGACTSVHASTATIRGRSMHRCTCVSGGFTQADGGDCGRSGRSVLSSCASRAPDGRGHSKGGFLHGGDMWEKCAHSVSCKMVGTVGEVCSARVRAVCSRARCAWDQPRSDTTLQISSAD